MVGTYARQAPYDQTATCRAETLDTSTTQRLNSALAPWSCQELDSPGPEIPIFKEPFPER